MDFSMNNQSYRVGRLPALTQFHVVRRLAPVLSSLGIGMAKIKELKGAEDFIPLIGAASEVLAAMSDDDSNYVIFSCLSVVSRDQGEGRYAPVTAGGRLMFEDLDMIAMLRLVIEVIKENFAGFMTGPAGGSNLAGSLLHPQPPSQQ